MVNKRRRNEAAERPLLHLPPLLLLPNGGSLRLLAVCGHTTRVWQWLHPGSEPAALHRGQLGVLEGRRCRCVVGGSGASDCFRPSSRLVFVAGSFPRRGSTLWQDLPPQIIQAVEGRVTHIRAGREPLSVVVGCVALLEKGHAGDGGGVHHRLTAVERDHTHGYVCPHIRVACLHQAVQIAACQYSGISGTVASDYGCCIEPSCRLPVDYCGCLVRKIPSPPHRNGAIVGSICRLCRPSRGSGRSVLPPSPPHSEGLEDSYKEDK
mmetsp:Transcript_21252/g.55289  ORF Transcript_21252/g.55289 Transcript_21252/m.55289 type:complete len:265 (+) Transcript_21252:2266-3060(+)